MEEDKTLRQANDLYSRGQRSVRRALDTNEKQPQAIQRLNSSSPLDVGYVCKPPVKTSIGQHAFKEAGASEHLLLKI